ncbi:homoserine O-acetyltransferase MetX [Halobacterium zhouii]|uniref:homoserine O-acetyltransferase MetX n=1 Tax=Halobacterium zhouii TaxID=2902624 RepID=UPI001E51EE41|nr:homoserine O-acetyltransferase [Halobacterium zhouii]
MPAQSLGRFEFECGRTIEELTVAYDTYGEFTGDNAVLVCHALTGSQHVRGADRGQGRGWWDDVVGPGQAIDTNEYFVVCANVPGSCYGTDGPSTERANGEPWGTDFPAVTVADWTRTQRRLLDELGVERLHAVLGGSVGGMNALDWIRRFPEDVDRVAAVAASPRLDAQCLGLNAVARRAIRGDPNWNEGDYYGDSANDAGGGRSDGHGDGHPDRGLALARQIGHLMYLSKDSMGDRFGRRTAGREAGDDGFPADPAAAFFPYRDVESYLDHQAATFTDRFDANSYLYLTRAMDNYDLSEGYASDASAVAAFPGEALVLSFTGDWHFTVDQSEELAEAFRESGVPVSHHVVESDHGHDAFLVEPESVGPPLRDFLADGVDGRAVTDTVERDEAAE